jgi:hypothetical protein
MPRWLFEKSGILPNCRKIKKPRGRGALVYELVLFSLNIWTNYIEVFKMATVPNRLDERPRHSKM